MGTPKLRRCLEDKADNPAQKNAPIVYGRHAALDPDLSLFLSIAIKDAKMIIQVIAKTDLALSGALNM